MTAAALLAVAGAMLLVRTGWGGRRSLAVLGWALAIVALLTLTRQDGAWGMAMGAVVGMATALAIVLQAGWVSPVRTVRPPRQAPAITLPRRPGDIEQRAAVFALVVPVAFAAAQWLAFGGQALARRGGLAEADTIVLMLFGQPLAWGIIMAAQMTRSGPAQMIAPPVAAAALGTLLWSAA